MTHFPQGAFSALTFRSLQKVCVQSASERGTGLLTFSVSMPLVMAHVDTM